MKYMLIIASIMLLIPSMVYSDTQPKVKNDNKIQIGQLAPDFTVNELSTPDVISLSDYRGRVVIIHFWATWCGEPCKNDVKNLAELYSKYKHDYDNFKLISISVNDDGKTYDFVQEHKIDFDVYLDRNMKVSDLYGIEGVPEAYVIDINGKIIKHIVGAGTKWNSKSFSDYIDSEINKEYIASNHQAKVRQIINNKNRMYINVQENSDNYWISSNNIALNIGDNITFTDSRPVLNYVISELDRVLPKIIFVNNIKIIKDDQMHKLPTMHNEVGGTGIDVDIILPSKFKTNPKNYAIVIGIENYRQKLPKADHATNDATVVTSYLTKTLGYPEENVITLTNDRALKSDLEKYFDKWLRNNVEKDANLFVYYSGHGAPNPRNGDAYLVPYDGDPAFIDETGYSLKRLYDNLSKLPAKNIVVALDACFSGVGGKSVVAKGSRALVRTEKTTAKNMIVLTASADDQISSSFDDKGHGVFTYYLLKGIKGIVEEDKFAKVEIGELYDYIKPQVEKTSRKLYNNEQTPQLIGEMGMRKIGLR